MAAQIGARRVHHGFTLVEMLIALALLALLMVVLMGALHSMGQVETRVEARVEAADDYRLATALLRSTLGRVSARQNRVQDAGGAERAPFFVAAPDSLSWIGVMPARYGLGGRHYLHLAVERVGDTSALVLRYAAWNGAPTFDDWASAAAQVIAAPVTALALRYQEPNSGAWSEVWPPPGVDLTVLPRSLLPAAVSVQINGPQPAWPPMAVAVAPTYSSDPGVMRGSFGGRVR